MPDLHDELERLAARAAAPPSTEDLLDHRDRRERRRARQALAAGLCVAILGTVLAFSALRPGDPVPADTPTPTAPLVVWPSNEDHDAAQASADAWRLDPEKVIDRFARSVLGWGEPVIEQTGPGSYLLGRGVEEEIGLHVTVAQPAAEGDGGIWSIQSVTHPEMAISVGKDAASFDIAIGDDRAAHVGVTVSNGCRDASAYEVGLDAGTFELALPEPTADDPACPDTGTGYVFVYVMDDTTVPTGDPLLEAAAIEYPWLTVLPIELPMESTGGMTSSEVLTVTCDGLDGDTVIDTSTVVAGPIGVEVVLAHVEASGTQQDSAFGQAGSLVFFDTERDPMGGSLRGSGPVSLPPGAHTVSCVYEGDLIGRSAAFEVVDPLGIYVPPTRLTCVQTNVSASEVMPEARDQDDLAFSAYEALWPGADVDVHMVLEGYPEDPARRRYAGVRPDGTTVGTVDFVLKDGRWFVERTESCT